MHLLVCVYSKICTLHISNGTPFIISSLRITVYTAVCTYQANLTVTSCWATSEEAEQLVTVSLICTNSCIYSDT